MKSIIMKLIVTIFMLSGAIQFFWSVVRAVFLTGSFIGWFTSGAIIAAGISLLVTLVSNIWSKS